MTLERPRVDALVLAELIDAVPARVRKRLDKNPEAALAWPWQQEQETWSIRCGEETVTLRTRQGVITSRPDVACSCLLSPKCFHILACVSVLASAAAETEDPSVSEEAAARQRDAEEADTEGVTPEQREAARVVDAAAASLLVVGAKHAGLLLQSALLRGGHACRSAGLIRLGNTVLRVVEGVQRLRSNADTADGARLGEDLAAALETAHLMLHAPAVPRWVVGQARRTFEPVGVRKLAGVCAEPVLTLSGYAGVCVYLQDAGERPPSHGLYTINELRTGDSQLVDQAYRGGIELGSLVVAAREICRRNLTVQGLSASRDGRLGKGRTTRWAVATAERDPVRLRQGRFGWPIEEQIANVFRAAQTAPDERPAGWDLVALDAVVLGPEQSALVVHVPALRSACRLTIAMDDPELAFRENLELLARCPRLGMRCLGRLNLAAAGEIALLAVAENDPRELANDGPAKEAEQGRPAFAFPESWAGLCNVGIDRLQRHHVNGIKRWSDDVGLGSGGGSAVPVDDGLAALRRRLVALALGGREAVPAAGSSAHRRDANRLRRSYQPTAARVLEDLATAASQHGGAERHRGTERERESPPLQDVFLAGHLYVREAALAYQRACWLERAGDVS